MRNTLSKTESGNRKAEIKNLTTELQSDQCSVFSGKFQGKGAHGVLAPPSTKTGTNGRSSKGANGQRWTRPPFDRMKRIFEMIQDGGFPNCNTIAAELGVGSRTVHRDIDFMRECWELPIAYDERKYGFYFAAPVDRFPGVPVTEKELFALCVAHKAIEQYQGTALQRPLELAFEKCLGQLDDQERFTLQGLGDVLSFRPFAPDDADLRLFELITAAIRERRELQFEYRKPGEKSADVRRVQPLHLMQFNHRWYLLAVDVDQRKCDHSAPEIRKFVLGRMAAVRRLDGRFVRPADFDARAYLKHSLGVMTGTGDYEVVIEMDPWLTDVLRGRRWHPSQVVTELPGGGSHLQLRLSCLEEIEQWVLSWGTRATVLRPDALAARIARTVQKLAARYRDAESESHCE